MPDVVEPEVELLPDFEVVDLALVLVPDLAFAVVEPELVDVDLLLLPEDVDCVGRSELEEPDPDFELDPVLELVPELPVLPPIPVLLPIDDESEDPDVLPDMLPDD